MEAEEAGPTTTFLDPRDKLWSLYLKDATKRDKDREDYWKSSTDGILIFTGLFAATIASFVIYTLPMLVPDTRSQTVMLLSHMLVLMHNDTSLALPDGFKLPYDLTRLDDGMPQRATAVVNVLLIMSLFLALACALASTLVQQWGRSYIHDSCMHAALGKRGLVHAGLEDGIGKSLNGTIALILTVLHIAVALFFTGLVVLVYTTPHIHTRIILTLLMAFGIIIYIVLSLCPLLSHVSPFHTPFTWIFTFCYASYCKLRDLLLCEPKSTSSSRGSTFHEAQWADKPRLAIVMLWQFVTDSKAWTANKRSACLDEALHGVPPHTQIKWIGSAFSRLMKSVVEVNDAVALWEAFVPFISSPKHDPFPNSVSSSRSLTDPEMARALRSYAANDEHDLGVFWERIQSLLLRLDLNKDSDAYFSRAVIACCTVTRCMLDADDEATGAVQISSGLDSLMRKISFSPLTVACMETMKNARASGALIFLKAELRVAVHKLALGNVTWLYNAAYCAQYNDLWLGTPKNEQRGAYGRITLTMVNVQLVLNFIDLFRNILKWTRLMGVNSVLDTLKETSWIPLVARIHAQALASAQEEDVTSALVDRGRQSINPGHYSALTRLLSDLGVTEYQALDGEKHEEGTQSAIPPTFSTVDARYRPLLRDYPKLTRMVYSLYVKLFEKRDVGTYGPQSLSRSSTARSSMIIAKEQLGYGRAPLAGARTSSTGHLHTSMERYLAQDLVAQRTRHPSSAAVGNKPQVPMNAGSLTQGLLRKGRAQSPPDMPTTDAEARRDSIALGVCTADSVDARECRKPIAEVTTKSFMHGSRRPLQDESMRGEAAVEAESAPSLLFAHAGMMRQVSSKSSLTVVDRDDVGMQSQYTKFDDEDSMLRESMGLLPTYWRDNHDDL